MTLRRWIVAGWPAFWAGLATPEGAALVVAFVAGCVSLALDAWSTAP